MRIVSIFLVLMVSIILSAQAWDGKDIGINVSVIDEGGKPVSNALVRGCFWDPRKKDYVGNEFNYKTDINGQCLIKGRGFNYVAGSVIMTNHYESHYKNDLGDTDKVRRGGDWDLTNIIITLKSIRNPVSMYVRGVGTAFGDVVPKGKESFAYDYFAGDWVQPDGKGVVSDIVFQRQMETNNWPEEYTYKLNVLFPNDGDGLQRFTLDDYSYYKSGYEAPVNGYEPKHSQERIRKKGEAEKSNVVRGGGYYFRIRTKKDNNGNVTNAYYGKIYGDFIEFSYYLNPTPNDRNVEFDKKKHLFPDQAKENYNP